MTEDLTDLTLAELQTFAPDDGERFDVRDAGPFVDAKIVKDTHTGYQAVVLCVNIAKHGLHAAFNMAPKRESAS